MELGLTHAVTAVSCESGTPYQTETTPSNAVTCWGLRMLRQQSLVHLTRHQTETTPCSATNVLCACWLALTNTLWAVFGTAGGFLTDHFPAATKVGYSSSRP
jgi:hypothetical protein